MLENSKIPRNAAMFILPAIEKQAFPGRLHDFARLERLQHLCRAQVTVRPLA
jgi:hypothetical protein